LQRIKKEGKETAPHGIPTQQLRGGITQEDMIKLEMRKKEILMDYPNVNKYLDHMECLNQVSTRK
jgi:hypothetical protein